MQYFVTVADELHFGRAAERLHIAQPSLSHQIRRLEQQLGVTLLNRTSRRVELTPAGRVLLTEGRRLLTQSERAIRLIRAAESERVTIGFYGSAANAWLARALRAFHERQSGVEVSVKDLLLGRIDEIVDGSVDVAFTRLLPGQADVEIEVIAREPRFVAIPSTHPLSGRASVTFDDLRNECFITNPPSTRNGPRSGGSPSRPDTASRETSPPKPPASRRSSPSWPPGAESASSPPRSPTTTHAPTSPTGP